MIIKVYKINLRGVCDRFLRGIVMFFYYLKAALIKILFLKHFLFISQQNI